MKGVGGFVFLIGMLTGLVMASVTAHYGIFEACRP